MIKLILKFQLMHFFTKKDIQNSLNKLKINNGDCIFIMFETIRLGMIKDVKNSNEHYKAFFEGILKKIGPKGTLATNTYTFENSRLKKNYQHLSKKCSSGKSSEIFLSFKNISRSVHPLFSVAAIGLNKDYICKNNSTHNYGELSPYSRLMEKNCKILSLGGYLGNNPFLHVAELHSGAPYMYNKIFRQKVFIDKKNIKKNFVSFVRYLHLKYEVDFEKIDNLLKRKNKIKKIKLGKGFISVCKSIDFYKTIIDLLKKDIHGILKDKPNYSYKMFPYL